MRVELLKFAPQTRAAPLAIQVKGLSFFQVHNRVFLFQPYAERSSRRCQVFVPELKPPTADTCNMVRPSLSMCSTA